MLFPTYSGAAYGVQGRYFFSSISEDSGYVSIHYYNEKYDSYEEALLGYNERSGTKAIIDIGNRWILWEKVTSQFGIGFEFANQHIVHQPSGRLDDENRSMLHIEYKIGYLF